MINKVEGPGGVRGSTPTRRTAKTGQAQGASFSQHLHDESVGGAEPVSGMQAVAGVGALIGLQEVEDATERAARRKKRATNILAELDGMRIALLGGTLTKDQLLRLSAMVQAQKDMVDDPGLSQILEDIDLRARVELAKYGF